MRVIEESTTTFESLEGGTLIIVAGGRWFHFGSTRRRYLKWGPCSDAVGGVVAFEADEVDGPWHELKLISIT